MIHDPNMTGPEHTELYLIEVQTEVRRVDTFKYSNSWLSPDGAAAVVKAVNNPESPITAIVKLWPVTVGAE